MSYIFTAEDNGRKCYVTNGLTHETINITHYHSFENFDCSMNATPTEFFICIVTIAIVTCTAAVYAHAHTYSVISVSS
jgi:hypothetical protein